MLEKSISSHLTEAEPMMDEFRAVKADQGSMKRTLDFLVQEQRSLRQDQLDHYRWTAEQAQDAGKARELGERIEALKQETRKEPRT